MTGTYTVRTVPPHLLGRFWPFAEPYVKRALDQASGEFSADDIRRMCETEVLRLWLVFDGMRVVAAATGEIVDYPTKRRLRVLTLGGAGFDAWVDELDAAFDHTAREFGCGGIEAFVRRGFVPKLATRKYRQRHVMVIKELAA